LPRALARLGCLEAAFTDFVITGGKRDQLLARAVATVIPERGRRMLERRVELDSRLIKKSLTLTAWLELGRRWHRAGTPYYSWASRQTAHWIRSNGVGRANILHGFVRNIDPQLCDWARGRGLRVLVDQMIAPAVTEARELRLQAERFPAWQSGELLDDLETVANKEGQTWAAAHRLTCPSIYVRDELVRAGVSAERIDVLPYPFEREQTAGRAERAPSERLRVGFVGSVSLRKGAPYFLEVARRLAGRMQFTMIGPLAVSNAARAELAAHVQLTGAVARSDVARRLAELDVILFPTTCEGSAGALMEALAAGLPVITAPNAGSVVRDGQEGFIQPYDDIDGMSASLERLADDRTLLASMSQAAGVRAAEFSLTQYADELAEVLQRLMES
jgi:glycosyltransferase involved in cell wall biosynthesis